MQGLKPITVEGEEERERELERKLEQERSLGGKGTADAPLDLGDDRAQSPPLAAAAFAHHRLYDMNGGAPLARHRSKQRAKVTKNGARGGAESDADGGGGLDGAAAAGGVDIDSLVAESSEPTRPERASGKKSSWDAATPAVKAPSGKQANVFGAGSGAGSGAAPAGDGPKDSASPSRRYRITSANHLPPGWEVARIEQPDKHVSYCVTHVVAERSEPAVEGVLERLLDINGGLRRWVVMAALPVALGLRVHWVFIRESHRLLKVVLAGPPCIHAPVHCCSRQCVRRRPSSSRDLPRVP